MINLLSQTHSFFICLSQNGEILKLSNAFIKLLGSVEASNIRDYLSSETAIKNNLSEYTLSDHVDFQLKLSGTPKFDAHVIENEGLYWLITTPLPADFVKLKQLGVSTDDLALADPLRLYIKSLEDLKAEVEKRSSELFHAERMASIGTLAAGVAHEINNPLAYVKSNLTSLQGFLRPMVKTIRKLLELEKDSPQIMADLSASGLVFDAAELEFIIDDLDEILADLRDGSDRIVTIVNGLRQFSHPATKTRGKSDLNEAVSVAIELSRSEFKYHANLETDLAEIPLLDANAGEITQVLVNLMVNAGQAIQDSGTIRVKSQKTTNGVEISVEDTGSGINSQDLAQIFNPFFTTKPVGKGTGLGLAISHRIMKEHGGEIAVESKPGVGTKFTLKFPLPEEH